MTSRCLTKLSPLGGWALLTSLALFGLHSEGRAELVSFGNTRYRHTEVQGGLSVTIDGTLNAAVYQRETDTGDIWGTGIATLANSNFTQGVGPNVASPALDTSAQYLYVYQLVNDGGSNQTIGSVGLTVKEATSWGAFNSLGFLDDEGPIASGNPLGTNQGKFDNVFRPDTGTAVIDQVNPQGIAINSVELKPDGAGPGFDSFRAVWSINGAVGLNQRSALFAFTSNSTPSIAIFSAQGASSVNAPTLGTITGQQGGGPGPGGGGTPSAAPEPSTLVLSCLGLSLFGARVWRNRRGLKNA